MPRSTQSLWRATTDFNPFPVAQNGSKFDVVIVGAGIVGVMTAYNLAKAGLKPALLEARSVLSGVTGHTTGKLTSQHGIVYAHIAKTYGEDKARAYADANEWAIHRVREIAELENIECDYAEDAAHVYSEGDGDSFNEELEICQSLRLPASVVTVDLHFGQVRALRYERQARYHPLKFLSGVLENAIGLGVSVFEASRATEIREEDGVCEIQTEKGTLSAQHVVVATNYPVHDSGLYVAKLAPYRSYAIAVDVERELPDGMFINDTEPMRSFRRARLGDRDVLIVGGCHHKVGQMDNTEDCYLEIESWANRSFVVRNVLYRWSTQDNWTPDRIPYIGKSPNREQIYIATGFGGWGMTNGVVAGKLLADLILERPNAWSDVYDPGRLSWGAVPQLISENVNTASHLIRDRLSRAELDDPTQVAPGQGAIVQLDTKRVAVYRDLEGEAHVVDSACTHMGCQLHWNNAETSWDCPCHGSRFGFDGEVLHAPAVEPLKLAGLDSNVAVTSSPETA